MCVHMCSSGSLLNCRLLADSAQSCSWRLGLSQGPGRRHPGGARAAAPAAAARRRDSRQAQGRAPPRALQEPKIADSTRAPHAVGHGADTSPRFPHSTRPTPHARRGGASEGSRAAQWAMPLLQVAGVARSSGLRCASQVVESRPGRATYNNFIMQNQTSGPPPMVGWSPGI